MAYVIAGTQVALALLALLYVSSPWTSLSIVFLIGLIQVLLAFVFGSLMKRMPKGAKRVGQTYFTGLLCFAGLLVLLRLGMPSGLENLIEIVIIVLSSVLYLLMLFWTVLLGHVKWKTN